jgi:uncharacterized protein (UPF0333 family)
MTVYSHAKHEEGQASIELLALIPLLGILALVGMQAVLVGQAWWSTRSAASAAARAQAVAQPVRPAALKALPRRLKHGVRVSEQRDGDGVTVIVRLPPVAGLRLGSVSARAQMESQR